MFKQNLNLKQALKLTPQQIQLMKLLQLTSLEFEEKIKVELEENPALDINESFEKETDLKDDSLTNSEFEDNNLVDSNDLDIDSYLSNEDDEPYYKTQQNLYSEDNEFDFQQTDKISLSDYLISQISTFNLSEKDLNICEFIIGNIDEDGYIRREISSITNDYIIYNNIFLDETYFENILVKKIHELEPYGIGARNLQECLVIQLNKKNKTKAVLNAILLLKIHFDLFVKNKYELLKTKLNITDFELKEAILEIKKLNPKPGASFISSNNQNQPSTGIIPDFILTIENNEIIIELNSKNIPDLVVSTTYKNIFETYKTSKNKTSDQKKATQFVKQKLDSAKGFIDMIKLRENNLLTFINELVKYQKNYFITGNEKELKPMILNDLALKTNISISTISRIVNNKYISTPYGTILIKSLFSEGTKNIEGDEISVNEIKNKILELINSEDKLNPLTDINLLNALKLNGYVIARRTVTKYREKLNLPTARLRKQF